MAEVYADFTHHQLTEFPAVDANVTHLILRRNRITHIDLASVVHLTNLVHLDLYDNGLAEFPDLSSFQKLIYVDLSFNKIGNFDADRLPPKIQQLYLACNRLVSLPPSFPLSLRTLECGMNRLKGHVSIPESLYELYLAANEITDVDASHAKSLRILALQLNQIANVNVSESLEELYLGNNASLERTFLDKAYPRLRVLDISSCGSACTTLDIPSDRFPCLEELWCEDNSIDGIISVPVTLKVIYLRNNPIDRANAAPCLPPSCKLVIDPFDQ